MKQELNLDYDITVVNLVDIDTEIAGFEIEEAEFFRMDTKKMEKETRKILKNEEKGLAIFKTKDGRYVLEVETPDMMVEYFYSYDINDLIL